MSNCRKLFKALLVATFFGGAFLSMTGCSKKADIHIDDTATLHEGFDLPDLIVNGNGTASWVTEGNDGKLLPGVHEYKYIYTDAETQKQTEYSIKLEATQHTSLEDEASTHIVKEPTCTEDGIKYFRCSICEQDYNQQSIRELGHDFSGIEHHDGDCMNKGYSFHVCTRCGELEKNAQGENVKYEDLEYGQHTWSTEQTVTEDPTCQEIGHGIVYCTNHEAHLAGQGSQEQDYKYVQLNPVNCDFSVEHYTAGDCMTKGYTEYTCKWCGTYKMVEGSETEHYKKIDEEFGAHVWEKDELGNEKISSITTEPTCLTIGTGIVKCVNCEAHASGEGLQTPATKEVVIDKVPCDFTTTHYTAGDCMNKGYTEYSCKWCGNYKMVEGSETEHYKTYDAEFGAHVWETDTDGNEKISSVTLEPTCQATGTGIVKCIYCTEHGTGEGNQSANTKTVQIAVVPHDYSVEHHTAGDCMTKGYTEYTCKWCEIYKMDGEEHFKVIDENFGAHIWATDAQGKEIIAETTTQPTCQTAGEGIVYCTHYEDHQEGIGNTVDTTKTVVIPVCDHIYDSKVYSPYSMTTCRTLGIYKLVCRWCGAAEPDVEGDYPYTDTEYLDHNYNEEGFCTNIYYEKVTAQDGSVKYATRVCNHSEHEVLGEFYLGGTPRAHFNENGTTTYHAGTYDDPSDTVIANIVREYDDKGDWTGKYVLYILSTEMNEEEKEETLPAGFVCYSNPTAVESYINNGTMDTTFASVAKNYIPWYEAIDTNGHKYLDLISTVVIAEEIKSLPNALLYNHDSLEYLDLTGLKDLKTLPSAFCYGCDNLKWLFMNDAIEKVSYGAFMNCPTLESNTIIWSRGLTTIDNHAFENHTFDKIDLHECSRLTKVGYRSFSTNKGSAGTILFPKNSINLNLGATNSDQKAEHGQDGSFPRLGYVGFVYDDFDENEVYNDLLNNVYFGMGSTYYLGKGHTVENTIININGVQVIDTTTTPIYAKHALSSTTNVGGNYKYPYLLEKYEEGFIIVNTLNKTLTDAQLQEVLNTEIKGVKVKDNLVAIGNQAFFGCSVLTTFELPTTVKEIREYAFYGCKNLSNIGKKISEGHYDFDESLALESIGSCAFYDCGLVSVSFPSTIKYLGNSILGDNESLRDIYFNDPNYLYYVEFEVANFRDDSGDVAPFTIRAGQGSTGGPFSIIGNSQTLTIHIGEDMQRLSTSLFSYMNGVNVELDLTNATKLTEIGSSAFYNSNFKVVDLSNSHIETIGARAFGFNGQLKEVILPETLTSVGDEIFSDCTALSKVTINSVFEAPGSKGLTEDASNVEFIINADVNKLPLLITKANTVTFTIKVKNTVEGIKGYGLVLNAGKYICEENPQDLFPGATVTTQFIYEINENPEGDTIATIFPTDLPVKVVLGKGITDIEESYFANLGANYTIVVDAESALVWKDADANYHYCDVLEKALGESFNGNLVLSNEKPLTFAHNWDLTHFVPGDCDNDSQGYKECLCCGFIDDTIEPKGHNYIINADKTTATCTVAGTISYICTRCHEGYEETDKLLDHVWERTEVKCDETGAKVVCAMCHATSDTENQGHYYYDSETNTYHMIDAEATGTKCCFCGMEDIISLTMGENGVVAQLYADPTDTYYIMLVTSAGTGTVIADGTTTASSQVWWQYRNYIGELIVGDCITKIGSYFIYNSGSSQTSYSLPCTEITIGKNVQSIGKYSFNNLFFLEYLYMNTGLANDKDAWGDYLFKYVNLSESVNGCNVIFADEVTALCPYAFYGDTNKYFTSFSFGPNFRMLYRGAFGGNKYVYYDLIFRGTVADFLQMECEDETVTMYLDQTQIFFGDSTTPTRNLVVPADFTKDVSPTSIMYCMSFDTLTVEEGNSRYKAVGNCLIDIAQKTLVLGLNTANIPADCTDFDTIGQFAFICSQMDSLVLPKACTGIDVYAFMGSSIKTIDLGGTQVIAGYSFANCTNLTTVYLRKDIAQIGAANFYGCSAITEAIYAGTADEWKSVYVASNNTSLTNKLVYTYNIEGLTHDELLALEGTNGYYMKDGNLYKIPATHTYESEVVSQEQQDRCVSDYLVCSFCGEGLEIITHTAPAGYEYHDCTVGGTTAYECSKCHEVINVTVGVGHYDANGEIITTGGINCAYCHKLIVDVLTMGENGVIAQIAQENASPLEYSAYVFTTGEGTAIAKVSSRGEPEIYVKYRDYLVSLVIDDAITEIGQAAFGAAQTTTSNSSYAGKEWVKLKTITIGKGVTKIGKWAFYGTDHVEDLYYNAVAMLDQTPEGSYWAGSTTYIWNGLGYKAPNYCTLHIGKDVTSLPNRVLHESIYLKDILFEEGCEITSIGAYAFYYLKKTVQNLVLPKTLTTLGSNSFYNSYISSSTTAIYFTGSAAEWDTFKGIANLATNIKNSTNVKFYSEAAEAGCWHYDSDGYTPVMWEI